MNELLNELAPHIINIVGVLLGYLAYKINKLINDKLSKDKQDSIMDIIKGAVAFVEQVAKIDVELVGKEKFEMAKQRALIVLEQKGFEISEEELEMLIERFVLGLGGDK